MPTTIPAITTPSSVFINFFNKQNNNQKMKKKNRSKANNQRSNPKISIFFFLFLFWLFVGRALEDIEGGRGGGDGRTVNNISTTTHQVNNISLLSECCPKNIPGQINRMLPPTLYILCCVPPYPSIRFQPLDGPAAGPPLPNTNTNWLVVTIGRKEKTRRARKREWNRRQGTEFDIILMITSLRWKKRKMAQQATWWL